MFASMKQNGMDAETIKRLQDEGLFFNEKEIDVLVDGAKAIGFEPSPYLIKEKAFNKADALVRGEIHFSHVISKNSLTINRSKIKLLELDILKNTAAEIFFSIIFKDIDDAAYEANYDPS